jgi:hypothetical protein
MNRKRRAEVKAVADGCERLRLKVARIHEDEYQYLETLWTKGLDESAAADASSDALDALSNVETLLTSVTTELQRIKRHEPE